MIRRKKILLPLLGILAAGLSGCVYLRLLEVKKQIKQFDTNFTITGRPDLVIGFVNPIMKKTDVKFLIGAEPLKQKEAKEDVFYYEFNMVRGSTAPAKATKAARNAVVSTSTVVSSTTSAEKAELPPLHRLTLNVVFRDDFMIKIIIPETFMLLFPRNVLVETLKQSADADVYETKRLVRAEINLPDSVDVELPSLKKTKFLLGEPSATLPDKDLQTYVYNFKIVKEARHVPIVGKLTFDSSGFLRRVNVRWDSSTIEANFIRD